jgi:hypothetical protein
MGSTCTVRKLRYKHIEKESQSSARETTSLRALEQCSEVEPVTMNYRD